MDSLSREDVWKIAKNFAEEETIRFIHYEVKKSEEVLGYLGKHLTLVLTLHTDAGKWEKRFFVKTYETGADKEDFLGETGIFKREQDFYSVVVEDVKKCLGSPDWCPQHYLTKDRILVLEDLTEKGFKMADGGLGPWALNSEHVEAVLRTLASLHATSMLLENTKSKCLPSLYPMIFRKELLYDEDKTETPTRKWINWQIQDLLEGVNYLNKYSNDEKLLIKDKFERQIMRIYALSKISEKYRNVLTHGDMWKNNLLFQYSKEGIPLECRVVDFQFTRYAPPAHDVLHCLHFATQKQTRDLLLPHFLHLYYENLRQRMKEHGADVEKEMPEREFVESCKEYKELALIQCLLSLHYLLGPVTLHVNTATYRQYEEYLANNRKNYMNKFFHDELYSSKITDIFHELIDTYIINKQRQNI